MKIIKFEQKYRDDMIFMNLTAKNALGTVPHLRDDLLNVEESYFKKGGYFWLAVNEDDRVIGSIGILPTDDFAEIKRLFIMPNLKRQGIGTKLLETLEEYAKQQKYTRLEIHLGEESVYWESRLFYKKHGYNEYQPRYMRKYL